MMAVISKQLSPLLLLSLILTVEGWVAQGKQEQNNKHQQRDLTFSECGLYLAPSDVFGELGVFTAQPLSKGDILNTYDVIIPLIEDDSGPVFISSLNTANRLIEWEGRRVRAYLAGTGSTLNRHAKFHNTEALAVRTDAGGLHRKTDPGVGAFSYQMMEYQVTKSIPVGRQIILNHDPPAGPLNHTDIAKIEDLIQTLENIFETEQNETSKSAILDMFGKALKVPVNDFFPATIKQFERSLANGTENAWNEEEDITASAEWLKESGVCLDNILPGTSTIPQAGRGAFATRPLKAGSIVAPVPVVPVSKYELEKDFDDEHQLLRNYCYGNIQSSLLLCPHGSPASYVNHASGNDTNVRIEWSTQLKSSHFEWSELSTLDVLTHPEIKLVMQLVATKDIQQGDEIFLNYGELWEYQWLTHFEAWEEKEGWGSYESALSWNQNENSKLLTEEEQQEKPYPYNIYVAMRFHYDPTSEPKSSRTGQDGRVHKRFPYNRRLADEPGALRPVRVLERHLGVVGGTSYTVQLSNHPLSQNWDPEHIPDEDSLVIEFVPRSELFFVDTLYTTDTHLKEAFRREIQLPDELFPEGWVDQLSEEYFPEENEGGGEYDPSYNDEL